MAAKLTRLTHKIAIKLHLVAVSSMYVCMYIYVCVYVRTYVLCM
jgi:hypothetical protein